MVYYWSETDKATMDKEISDLKTELHRVNELCNKKQLQFDLLVQKNNDEVLLLTERFQVCCRENEQFVEEIKLVIDILKECIDSLRYVDKTHKEAISGYGVREQRIEKAKTTIERLEKLCLPQN
jgi:hypothetical protein